MGTNEAVGGRQSRNTALASRVQLREKVTNFFCQLYFRSGCMVDEDEVLAEFPPHLRRHMAQHMYGDFIQRMPFFRGLELEIIMKLYVLPPHLGVVAILELDHL